MFIIPNIIYQIYIYIKSVSAYFLHLNYCLSLQCFKCLMSHPVHRGVHKGSSNQIWLWESLVRHNGHIKPHFTVWTVTPNKAIWRVGYVYNGLRSTLLSFDLTGGQVAPKVILWSFLWRPTGVSWVKRSMWFAKHREVGFKLDTLHSVRIQQLLQCWQSEGQL